MQLLGLKTDKPQDMKTYKKRFFYHLLANIFARTEQKIELFCKVKDKDFSFCVDDFWAYKFVGFWAYKFVGFWVYKLMSL